MLHSLFNSHFNEVMVKYLRHGAGHVEEERLSAELGYQAELLDQQEGLGEPG